MGGKKEQVGKIRYKGGYKYQLDETYEVKVCLDMRGLNITTKFITLYSDGVLRINAGYAWDGASGPAVDTKNFMRGSMVHDALYQLIRQGYLEPEYRDEADEELRRVCLEDGMSRARAWWVYNAVRTFAKRSASPESKKEVWTAP